MVGADPVLLAGAALLGGTRVAEVDGDVADAGRAAEHGPVVETDLAAVDEVVPEVGVAVDQGPLALVPQLGDPLVVLGVQPAELGEHGREVVAELLASAVDQLGAERATHRRLHPRELVVEARVVPEVRVEAGQRLDEAEALLGFVRFEAIGERAPRRDEVLEDHDVLGRLVTGRRVVGDGDAHRHLGGGARVEASLPPAHVGGGDHPALRLVERRQLHEDRRRTVRSAGVAPARAAAVRWCPSAGRAPRCPRPRHPARRSATRA